MEDRRKQERNKGGMEVGKGKGWGGGGLNGWCFGICVKRFIIVERGFAPLSALERSGPSKQVVLSPPPLLTPRCTAHRPHTYTILLPPRPPHVAHRTSHTTHTTSLPPLLHCSLHHPHHPHYRTAPSTPPTLFIPGE